MTYLPVARRQQLLLEAGARVIARSGIGGATTRAVVTEAGMPLASFHYAFTSHEEFLLRLIERELAPDPPPLPEAMTSFEEALEVYIGLLLDGDSATEGVAAELAMHALQHEGLREVIGQRLVSYDALLGDALARLAAAYEREWNLPPQRLARQINAWRFGSFVQDAYARRSDRYAGRSAPQECAALLAGATRPRG